jgi:DNA-binding winged helix-turn-helix (wHTH) protein
MDGKPQPIIRIFVDDMPMTKGCFRTCWFQTVIKQGFEFNEKHKDIAARIINSMGSRRKYEDDDEFKVFKDSTKSSKNTKKSPPSSTIVKKGWKPVGLFKR